jgi:hypothetical protein
MSREFIWAVLWLLISGVGLLADDRSRVDLKGKFVKLDQANRTVTIRIDGKDMKFDLLREIRFYDEIDRQLKGGLEEAGRYFREGQAVIVTFETISGRRVATRLRAARESGK